MLADNYILEKDNMEDYTNKFSEKKIFEINNILPPISMWDIKSEEEFFHSLSNLIK